MNKIYQDAYMQQITAHSKWNNITYHFTMFSEFPMGMKAKSEQRKDYIKIGIAITCALLKAKTRNNS